ncbi:hypothetical protein [Sandaracinus amylolyticus]|uniref:hypothetical protein n=1 Tax=Sandaracinus amylolyticus TaxID=927083 RepID=UPI001F37D82C|nr:hypothetical protein [Sandaracinus amylolyticus]UJR84148.1 Hypothetical protein I5071_62190 [Sandaracinus amylolyticus]
MRIAAWALLVALAVFAVLSGDVVVGLAVGAVKCAVVGAEYMELRHAHRLHALAALGAVVVMTVALVAITS